MSESQAAGKSSGPDNSFVPTVVNRSRNTFCIWVAALAFVLAALLHESLFEGKGLVPADGIFGFPPWMETNGPSNDLLVDQYAVFLPQHEFMHQEFLRGKFPLWNSYQDCGRPNLASMQGALLFPINLLLLPLDPFYSGGPAAFLKLFLAGWFTMLYLRQLGASNSAAFLSGLVFSLSGFMIVWLGHPHVNCAMWLPLLLLLIEKLFHFGRRDAPGLTSAPAMRLWIGLAAVFGCLLLGGHPPTIIQVLLVAGIYFLFCTFGQWKNQPFLRAGICLGALAVGFLLAAPQLLPFLEYCRHSSIDDASHVLNRSEIRLPPNTMILYLLPHLSGSPAEGFGETMLQLGVGKQLPNFNERTGYVGILPWLFALYAVVGRRNRWILFYIFTIVISLLAIYGVPPFPAVFGMFPILRDINETRLTMVVGFGVAVLAGFGWDKFCHNQNRRALIWATAGFWAAIGLALLWFWHFAGGGWHRLDVAHRDFLRPQFLMLLGSFAVSVVLLFGYHRQRQLYSAITLGWIAVDLLVFGMGYNPAISHAHYYPRTPAIQWLKQQPGNFRIFGSAMVLIPNTAEIYGLQDARGYDFMTVRRYEKLITGKTGEFFFYQNATELPKPFQLLGVKYLLNFNSPPPDPKWFDLVYSNEITIYCYRKFRERALAVFDYRVDTNPTSVLATVRSGTFDPAQFVLLEKEPEVFSSKPAAAIAATNSSAQIISDEPDEVIVKASLPQPGFVLLLDTYFPGWTATVNGIKSPILRADYNFRAVQLPAGESTIRFAYQPSSFWTGTVLFLCGMLILTAVWIWSRKITRHLPIKK